MNVIYDLADIRISEVHTQRVEVPRWEIPVLQVIHGNDVVVVGQTVIKRAIPDPADEFQRLATRYGPKNEATPAVAAIYGNFGPGTAALRKEIRDSLTSANETPSAYRTPAERKIDAEKTASASGQTIAQEAKAIEDAKVVGLVTDAAKTTAAEDELPRIEGLSDVEKANLPAVAAALSGAAQSPDAKPFVIPSGENKGGKLDADIASLI